VDAAIILAGGEPVDLAIIGNLPSPALVIAADSGLALAEPLGLTVDLVVGDMDSVDPELLANAQAAGVPVERHDPNKDASDLELAMDAALQRGATQMVVVGGAGGRIDHLLANAALLGNDRFAAAQVTWLTDQALATVVRRQAVLSGSPGDVVTLLALGGPARGITSSGLVWPLDGETLEPGSTRGLSNEMTGPNATVEVGEGALLAIQPRGTP